MRSSGQSAQHLDAVRPSPGLAEYHVIQHDCSVGREHGKRLTRLTHRERLAPRHARYVFACVLTGENRLIDVGSGYRMWHADLRQQLLPAR